MELVINFNRRFEDATCRIKVRAKTPSVDQKQQRLDVCLELKENAANDSSFLSNVITGDETWVYAYDPETKTQSSQWKSPGSPRPKKARQVRSNIKSMLICFFDQKGIVHKEFVSPGQRVNSAFYVGFETSTGECVKEAT